MGPRGAVPHVPGPPVRQLPELRGPVPPVDLRPHPVKGSGTPSCRGFRHDETLTTARMACASQASKAHASFSEGTMLMTAKHRWLAFDARIMQLKWMHANFSMLT